MKRIATTFFSRHLPAVATAAALLAACGGGGIGSGGTGNSGFNGVAMGVVGGLGSIFVGGVRCDDLRAAIGSNSTTGAPDPQHPDVKVGQNVIITFDATVATCKVLKALVDPELVGRVSSTAPLVVAGQTVELNADPSIAPVTVLEGYDSAADIQAGDRVEVHGKPVLVNGNIVLRATRIEKKPAADAWVRVKGVVKNLAGAQFTLGGLTVRTDGSTRLDPGSLTLANDQTVVVWSNAPVAGDGSVTAQWIKAALQPLANDQAVRIEGLATGCSASPCNLPTLDGIAVDLSAAAFVNGSLDDVANGVAMRVEGQYDSGRSRLVASKASVRKRDAAAGNVTLIGLVANYVSNAQFTVRGMPVTTDANTQFNGSCSLADGQPVGVQGRITGSQVTAERVDCLNLVDGLTLDIFGALQNVDTVAKTFNLSEGPYRNYLLTWDDNTVFGTGVSPTTLSNGQRVGLRAVLSEGKLVVKRMVGDPTPTNVPPGVQLFGNLGLAHGVTASSLRVNAITMNIVPGTTTLVGNVADGVLVRTWFYRTGPAQPFIAVEVRAVTFN